MIGSDHSSALLPGAYNGAFIECTVAGGADTGGEKWAEPTALVGLIAAHGASGSYGPSYHTTLAPALVTCKRVVLALFERPPADRCERSETTCSGGGSMGGGSPGETHKLRARWGASAPMGLSPKPTRGSSRARSSPQN